MKRLFALVVILFISNLGMSQGVTGVEGSLENANQIQLYPNPSVSEFVIDVGLGAQISEIVVSDLLGQVVLEDMDVNQQAYQFGEAFLPGIYLVRAKFATGQIVTYKVVKDGSS